MEPRRPHKPTDRAGRIIEVLVVVALISLFLGLFWFTSGWQSR